MCVRAIHLSALGGFFHCAFQHPGLQKIPRLTVKLVSLSSYDAVNIPHTVCVTSAYKGLGQEILLLESTETGVTEGLRVH